MPEPEDNDVPKGSEDQPPFPLPGSTLLGNIPPTDPAIIDAIMAKWEFNKHYSTIGQVAAAWAYFEAFLDTWTGNLLDRPFAMTACLSSQMMGSRPKLDAFISLAKVLGCDPKWDDKLEKFAKKAVGKSEVT